MEEIINQIINNFDFGLIAVINIVTYSIIKFIDDVNGNNEVSLWQKRLVLIIVTICSIILFKLYTDTSVIVIINSAISAPVVWSWIIKPIAVKTGIDYKHKI